MKGSRTATKKDPRKRRFGKGELCASQVVGRGCCSDTSTRKLNETKPRKWSPPSSPPKGFRGRNAYSGVCNAKHLESRKKRKKKENGIASPFSLIFPRLVNYRPWGFFGEGLREILIVRKRM